MLLRVTSSRERQGGDNDEVAPETYDRAVEYTSVRQHIRQCWICQFRARSVAERASSELSINLLASELYYISLMSVYAMTVRRGAAGKVWLYTFAADGSWAQSAKYDGTDREVPCTI